MEDETKSINDLQKAEWNPRTISKHDFDALVTSMGEFGDLSGVVKNIETGNLVGGHQRLEAFKRLSADKIHVTHHLSDGPSPVGTTAYGFIEMLNGERFSYREVMWAPEREKAANIAANRIQGEFNLDMLAELNFELSQLEDGQNLLALTGQTEDELNSLLRMVSGEGGPDQEPEIDPENLLQGDTCSCPKCGFEFVPAKENAQV